MKNRTKNIIRAIILTVIIIGIIVTAVAGLSFDLKYRKNQSVEFTIGKEVNEEEIKSLAKEVFEKQEIAVELIEVYKDAVRITTTEITDEQKANLVSKVNEKYETEVKEENINIENNGNIRGRSIIIPYIISMAIVTVILLICQAIRYRKLNALKVIITTIINIVVYELLLLSIIAIIRVPVAEYITALILAVYVITICILTAVFEKNLDKIKYEENEK